MHQSMFYFTFEQSIIYTAGCQVGIYLAGQETCGHQNKSLHCKCSVGENMKCIVWIMCHFHIDLHITDKGFTS